MSVETLQIEIDCLKGQCAVLASALCGVLGVLPDGKRRVVYAHVQANLAANRELLLRDPNVTPAVIAGYDSVWVVLKAAVGEVGQN